jgi:hypothetical protein
VWLAIENKMSSDGSIEYQGQQIKLNKSYGDYDEYMLSKKKPAGGWPR